MTWKESILFNVSMPLCFFKKISGLSINGTKIANKIILKYEGVDKEFN